MLLAANADPLIAAYRDEILFQQTVHRYTSAWHHREPLWYFLVEVVPWLWLPLTALVPWLVPRWRRALREHDLRIALLLAWVALVLLFFSISTGKRGVYVLPAVPAFALVCAPFLREIAARVAAQRTLFAVAALVALVTALAVPYLLLRPAARLDVIAAYDFDPFAPLIAIAVAASLVCAIARPRHGFVAFGATLASILLVVSFWINPAMNDSRSGKAFIARVERVANPSGPLGFVAFKEQYLLNANRPVVHFGHARWRESEQETMDAARWLSGGAKRQLVVNEASLERCFHSAEREPLGTANRTRWYLVRGSVDRTCIERGQPHLAHFYNPRSPDSGKMASRH
jgi:4-amino-4-deoxy-L-arabinose transferase-like glycosyltransferase